MDESFCGSAFWDLNETIANATFPDLTKCFQVTVLVWVPCGYLLIVAPFYIWSLSTLPRNSIRHTWLNVTKTVLCSLLLVLSLVDVVRKLHEFAVTNNPYPAHVLAPFLTFLAMSTALLLTQFGRTRGVRVTGFLFLYWFLQFIAAVVILQSNIRTMISMPEDFTSFHLVHACIFTLLVSIEVVLCGCFVDCAGKQSDNSNDPRECPESSACFLSVLSFWWFNQLVILGYKRPLTKLELWYLNPEDRSKSVVPHFEKYWKKELLKSARSRNDFPVGIQDAYGSIVLRPLNGKDTEAEKAMDDEVKVNKAKQQNPRLWLALIFSFWRIFVFSAFLKLIHDILVFVSPLLLKAMINFVDDKTEPTWRGYTYAVLMFVVAFLQSLILHQYFHRCMITGMRIRTALVASVYKKSLLLSNAARKKSTVGEIVNLMSVDAQRFVELTTYINMLWSAPFQMCVCLYFLWMVLGPSVLAGVAVMVLMIPINAVIAKKAQFLQVIQMKHKDSRIKLMNEVLNGIKVLKLYAWEPSFEQKILDIRNEELLVLRKSAYLNAASSFTWTCAPFLVSLTTFAVYVLSSEHNILDAEKAFVALSLFNILRFPLAMLPMLIATLVQTSVSIKRLQNFLANEELDSENVIRKADIDNAVVVENGTFSWETADEKPALENINLRVKPGSFIGVVGQVGCGKSTLLSAILGETVKCQGSVAVRGSIAYVAQQAWIQNETLENNILFKRSKDDVFYEKVVDACALREDLKILPAGDQTEIGEKGINLSGGQKQRISLARAVYFDSDVYLLDDPLSAVDSRVGKHIFDQVLSNNGLLKGKTRLLVTHGISYLSQLDLIVVMVDGRISEMGTYRELLTQNGDFAEFLRTYLENEDLDNDADFDTEEIQLREEILSQIGSSPDLRRSMERLHRLRRDTSKSSDGGGTTPGENCPLSPTGSAFSDVGSGLKEAPPSSADSRDVLVQVKMPVHHKTEEPIKNKDERRRLLTDKNLESSKGTVDKSKESCKRRGSEKILHELDIASNTDDEAVTEEKQEKNKLIEDEKLETGKVKLNVFLAYIKSIGLMISSAILLLYIVDNAVAVYANFWLSEWSNDKAINGTVDTKLRDLRLGIYGLLGIGQGVLIILNDMMIAYGCTISCKRLHYDLIRNVLRCALDFFDRIPLGRLMNRFSKDLEVIDTPLPQSLDNWLNCVMEVAATLVVLCYGTPFFLVPILPLLVMYIFIQRFYVATSRQLRRLESISRSPVYSHFTETLQGVATIRAYNQQERFIRESELKVDENQTTYYPGIVSHRWLAVRLEFVGNCLVLSAAIFAVIGRDHLSPGIVGLSITYALNITQTLNWMVRMSSELETNIVAVERVKEYSEIETEAAWVKEGNRPGDDWPTEGHVVFHEYSTRYRKGLDPVLRNINCDVNGGEKIGIVGRTGAGKSSLALAIFRIIEPSAGTICIDGVDIAQIGLHDLRSKITVIPQDPVIFAGSLRMNLDPFNRYSDEEIWRALEHSHLKPYIVSLSNGLLHECSEGGDNLSVGHRQLICLARAILRKSKVLLLDEATSSVDLETDSLIQSTIREQFASCTVITIAHRLNTIMDYDRVMVLDCGEVKEFDAPQTLLLDKESLFFKMAADAKLTG